MISCRRLFLASANTDIDSLLHVITADPTVVGYILLSPDGVPIRFHEAIPYHDAILYASLVCDFHTRSKLTMTQLMGNTQDSELTDFRMRTDQGKELIVTICGEYLLVVIQNCSPSGDSNILSLFSVPYRLPPFLFHGPSHTSSPSKGFHHISHALVTFEIFHQIHQISCTTHLIDHILGQHT